METQTAASELPPEDNLWAMMPAMLWHALALLALCTGQLTTEEEIQVPLGNGDWIHLSQFCRVCNGYCWSVLKDYNAPLHEISRSVSSFRLGSGLYRKNIFASCVVLLSLFVYCSFPSRTWCETTSNISHYLSLDISRISLNEFDIHIIQCTSSWW